MRTRIGEMRVRPLNAPPDNGLSGVTTPEERLALVEQLTEEAWSLSGAPRPSYSRANIPVVVVRRGDKRSRGVQ